MFWAGYLELSPPSPISFTQPTSLLSNCVSYLAAPSPVKRKQVVVFMSGKALGAGLSGNLGPHLGSRLSTGPLFLHTPVTWTLPYT
jgi:hypothetical protein